MNNRIAFATIALSAVVAACSGVDETELALTPPQPPFESASITLVDLDGSEHVYNIDGVETRHVREEPEPAEYGSVSKLVTPEFMGSEFDPFASRACRIKHNYFNFEDMNGPCMFPPDLTNVRIQIASGGADTVDQAYIDALNDVIDYYEGFGVSFQFVSNNSWDVQFRGYSPNVPGVGEIAFGNPGSSQPVWSWTVPGLQVGWGVRRPKSTIRIKDSVPWDYTTLRGILCHEFGHYVGLSHTNLENTCMYAPIHGLVINGIEQQRLLQVEQPWGGADMYVKPRGFFDLGR